jgi:hypothetical protein
MPVRLALRMPCIPRRLEDDQLRYLLASVRLPSKTVGHALTASGVAGNLRRMPTHNPRLVGLVLLLIPAQVVLLRPQLQAQSATVGTFRWQLQPYCNLLTVSIVQQGTQFHVDGTDDLCGTGPLAGVVGRAFPNPDGTIGFGLITVTTTGAAPIHIDARISLATVSGPWTDSAGNAGTFLFTPGAGTSGSPRPIPPGGIAPGTITGAQLAAGSVTSTQLAPGAVGTAQLAPGVVAGLVASFGTCGPGQYLRGIQPNGTVLCEPIGTPPTTAVLSDSAIGGCCGSRAMAIGSDGLPIISHLDSSGQALALTRCLSASCTSAVTRVVDDPANSVGVGSSLAIGVDGFAVIAHQDTTAQALRVTHCENVACTVRASTTVDDSISIAVGGSPAIAIGRDGFPVISHQGDFSGPVRVTHCLDVACTKSTSLTVDNPTGTFFPRHTAIAIGSDGFPIIAYKDISSLALRVRHCLDVACTKSTFLNVDVSSGSDVGRLPSIAIGNDGLAIISHFDNRPPAAPTGNLRVTHCNDVACSSASSTTIDVGDPFTPQSSGINSSLAIGTDGLAVISHYDPFFFGTLRVARCNNVACTSATSTVVIGGGPGSSMAIGRDGLPLFAHPGLTASTLRVTKCMSRTCS